MRNRSGARPIRIIIPCWDVSYHHGAVGFACGGGECAGLCCSLPTFPVCGTCARAHPGALLARDPLAEREAGVLVTMAGAWDASENVQGGWSTGDCSTHIDSASGSYSDGTSVLDMHSTRRRTCAVRRARLDGVESAAHTPIHWWRSERVAVGGSIRVGVREAGVCETGGAWRSMRCWRIDDAALPGRDASHSVSAWTARGCSKGEGADDLGACGGSYESLLPTCSFAAEVEGGYACANLHAVHFRLSFLFLLSISSPTASASVHNLFLVMHGHIPRGRLALLQLVFYHMVTRHGLGVYAYTRCVAVCAKTKPSLTYSDPELNVEPRNCEVWC
ncbi:hypothetical protein B0H13DRAFT_1885157 [Mycena leptocephala]|nr:hypothetical protein B0H13DRAFT_1885157 [Mycena leptocephala]